MGEEEDANSRLMTRKRKLGGRVMRASQTFMPGEVVLMRAHRGTDIGVDTAVEDAQGAERLRAPARATAVGVLLDVRQPSNGGSL